jgi:hypothetical protein
LYDPYGRPFYLFRNFAVPLAVILDEYRTLSTEERGHIRLFLGHAPLHTGEPDIDQADTITLLRNPVPRVMSFCQHVSEGKSRGLREMFPPESFSLDTFLLSNRPEFDNTQTRNLLGLEQYMAVRTRNPDTVANMAFEVLRKELTAFGLTEYFDESLMLFAKTLNWPCPLPECKSYNRHDKENMLTFTDQHYRRILEMNRIDMALYRQALKLFKERMESAGIS